MLAALAFAPPPLATFAQGMCSAYVGRQRSVPDRPGLASLDTRPNAGAFLRSVQVAGYKSVADVAPGLTRSLRSLRSSRSIPSIQRIVPVAPLP